jgi:hypothetical protein
MCPHSIQISIETRIDIFRVNGRQLIDNAFCFAVLTDLQIGILQEIHGVNLVFGSDVHSRGLVRGRDGGKVRLNIFVPEAEASKNVGGHVQRMRRGGSDLRVTAGGREAQVGKMRIIGGVD